MGGKDGREISFYRSQTDQLRLIVADGAPLTHIGDWGLTVSDVCHGTSDVEVYFILVSRKLTQLTPYNDVIGVSLGLITYFQIYFLDLMINETGYYNLMTAAKLLGG